MVFRIILFFVFSASLLAQELQEKVSMQVKDVYNMTIPAYSDIQLSRRGIVLLNKISDNKWQLIALKPGFLVVKVEGETQSKIYMVEVLKEEKDFKEKKKASELPDWLCEEKGVRCDLEKSTVSGFSDNIHYYYAARELLKNKKNVLFNVDLSSHAGKKIQNLLQNILPAHHSVRLSEKGTLSIFAPCSRVEEEQIKHQNTVVSLLKDIVPKDHIAVQCIGKPEPLRYLVRAVFFLIKETVAKDIGLETEISADLVNFQLNPAMIFASLKNKSHEKDVRVLAEPLLKAQSFRETKIKSGGELPYQKAGKSHATVWKQHGINFQFELQPVTEKKVNFSYQCELSLPLAESNTSQASSMSGEIIAEHGNLEFAGAMSFEHTQNGTSLIPLLSKIPIIAPIFKTEKMDQAKSYLVLFLKIEAL